MGRSKQTSLPVKALNLSQTQATAELHRQLKEGHPHLQALRRNSLTAEQLEAKAVKKQKSRAKNKAARRARRKGR